MGAPVVRGVRVLASSGVMKVVRINYYTRRVQRKQHVYRGQKKQDQLRAHRIHQKSIFVDVDECLDGMANFLWEEAVVLEDYFDPSWDLDASCLH